MLQTVDYTDFMLCIVTALSSKVENEILESDLIRIFLDYKLSSVGLYITITILDIIHTFFYLEHDVSETGFCLRLSPLE
jgi:hypothetical protein